MRLNGQILQNARDRKVLSQAEAAAEIGISIPTYSRAERGDDVWPSTARAILAFYGLDAADVALPRKEDGDAA